MSMYREQNSRAGRCKRGADDAQNSAPAAYRIGAYELDISRVELRRNGETLPIPPLVFEVLRYLVEHRDRVVPKGELLDELWGHRFVSESTLATRIKGARKLLGDDGQSQSMIRTVRGRGYQFVGPLDEAADPGEDGERVPPVAVRFATVRGGVRLAIGSTGSGPALLKVANWMTHVDKDADSPIWGHWVRDLSRHHQFVRYDARGCGLSDRDLADIALNDLDLWVDDVARVAGSMELERFALLGLSQGGPVAIAFAARYPDRVSHLILHGTYAQGMNRRGDAQQVAQASLQVALAKFGWASEDSRFLEIFTRQFIPDAGQKERSWFNELQKTSCTGQTAAQLEAAMHDADVREMAGSLRVPTLVTHCRDEVAVPFEEGRSLAGLIPRATFLPLQCANHVMLERDAAWPEFVAAVDQFTGVV
jgi:DNA-binding winged helix-turn-helix (wHTH) protein/pimeloyl-ACP methyl ester carboxylesterase